MARIQDIDIPHLEFAEAAAPGTPAAGIVRIYAKTDGNLYQKDDAGLETGLAGGGGGGAPTTAKYVTTAADGTLSAEILRPQLGNYFNETPPVSANATYDDEFDDATGMSGTVNGLNARWAWRNQGTSTITYGTAGWGKIALQSQGGNNFRGIDIAALADGTYDTCVSVGYPLGTGSGVHGAGGMALIDHTNGDFYFFGKLRDTTTEYIAIQRWTNATTFSANDALITIAAGLTRAFLRVVKSGTTLEFWFSSDGIAFQRVLTTTDAVSATRIGLLVNENMSTGLCTMYVDYFRKVA